MGADLLWEAVLCFSTSLFWIGCARVDQANKISFYINMLQFLLLCFEWYGIPFANSKKYANRPIRL